MLINTHHGLNFIFIILFIIIHVIYIAMLVKKTSKVKIMLHESNQ
jgi:hypothetical protein